MRFDDLIADRSISYEIGFRNFGNNSTTFEFAARFLEICSSISHGKVITSLRWTAALTRHGKGCSPYPAFRSHIYVTGIVIWDSVAGVEHRTTAMFQIHRVSGLWCSGFQRPRRDPAGASELDPTSPARLEAKPRAPNYFSQHGNFVPPGGLACGILCLSSWPITSERPKGSIELNATFELTVKFESISAVTRPMPQRALVIAPRGSIATICEIIRRAVPGRHAKSVPRSKH